MISHRLGKIFAMYISMYTKLSNLKNEKTTQFKKWAQYLKRHFTKKVYMKRDPKKQNYLPKGGPLIIQASPTR